MKLKHKTITKGRKFKVVKLEGRIFTYFVIPKEVEIQTYYSREREAHNEFMENILLKNYKNSDSI